jgi:multidrug/hemolysin transport system permease protein
MLIKRNLLLFFRDRSAVFFSLLAVLIILGLYVLFLGNIMEQGLQAQLGFESDKIAVAVASLTLAGMIAVTSVTSCLGALEISIEDKKGASKDFRTSPVSRGKILSGYVISSGIIGLIMTGTALIICVIYLCARGASLPSFADCTLLVVTSVLSVLCGNAMVFFGVMFIKSQGAYTSASTVIGTLIGFLMGVYIPVGNFPDTVQWVIKLFPMSHAASMYKQILADGELAELFAEAARQNFQAHSLSGASEALGEFRELFGVVFRYGSYESGFWFSAAVLIVTTVIFYGLSLIVMTSKARNRSGG